MANLFPLISVSSPLLYDIQRSVCPGKLHLVSLFVYAAQRDVHTIFRTGIILILAERSCYAFI